MENSKLTGEWINLAIKEKGSLGELKKLIDIHSTNQTVELLALSRKLIDNCRKHSLYELELFVRKLRVQHFIFFADDPGNFLQESLDDVVTAHLPQSQDSEMRHCIVDNLLAAYSKMDAYVHAENIMKLAQEQLQVLKPGTSCYSCHEKYIIQSLSCLQRFQEAQQIVDASIIPKDDVSASYDKHKSKADIHYDLGEFEAAYQYVKVCEWILKSKAEKVSAFRKRSFYFKKATIEAKLNLHGEAAQTLQQVKEYWYHLRWLASFLECFDACDTQARISIGPLDKTLIDKAYDLSIKQQLTRSAFNINCYLFTIFLSESNPDQALYILERLEALSVEVVFRDMDYAKIKSLRERLATSN